MGVIREYSGQKERERETINIIKYASCIDRMMSSVGKIQQEGQ